MQLRRVPDVRFRGHDESRKSISNYWLIYNLCKTKENNIMSSAVIDLPRVTDHYNLKGKPHVEVTELGQNQSHEIALTSRSINLLKRAYRDVFQEAFPIKEEREPYEALIKGMKEGYVKINIVGEDFNGPNPVLKGMCISYLYKNEKAGLMGYLTTSPKYQGQGIGKALTDAHGQSMLNMLKENGSELDGLFLECNLPTTQNDVMDPVKRIQIYEKWGAVTLPIFYAQPPLETGGNSIELKLLVQPHPETGKYPDKTAIKGYLKGIYDELAEYAGMPTEKNPEYLRSIKDLDKLDLGKFYNETLAQRQQHNRPATPGHKP